jgi:hypothetical protein
MNPALYQHWKRQLTERLRRERLIAARRAAASPIPAPDPDPESSTAPAKRRRSE